MPHVLSAETRECIDRCRACKEICLEAINHCLMRGGRHAEADHIRTLAACAEICETSARLMLLGSSHHLRVCQVCAEICDACARDCEEFHDDETMQRCAGICQHCAETCRQMAGVPAQ